uniref:DUF4351 domain-containing protein n=1 Tax=Thermogemmatispora argillosa TaxID=2045280 RepID=A0A455SXI5_9CHLR|nr:hypothetical protein KTA_12760 [Thermogemmatispora argillosa]
MSLDDLIAELKQTDAARALIEEGLRQGIEQGRQEGRQEGLQQGRQEGLHKARQRLLTTVSARFPHLYGLAAQVVARLDDFDALLLLLEQVVSLPDAEHLRAWLLSSLSASSVQPSSRPSVDGSQ